MTVPNMKKEKKKVGLPFIYTYLRHVEPDSTNPWKRKNNNSKCDKLILVVKNNARTHTHTDTQTQTLKYNSSGFSKNGEKEKESERGRSIRFLFLKISNKQSCVTLKEKFFQKNNFGGSQTKLSRYQPKN